MKLQIKIDGKIYEAEVEILDDEASQPGFAHFSSTGQMAPAPGAYTPGHAADAHSADEKQYSSPVNGLVIKVNAKPRQEVRPGDVMMVLEAMKMETSIIAHHAGRVKSVKVAQGDPVKLHQVLIELE